MVIAVIRPEKFDAVKRGLEAIGIVGMTVTEVRGRGEQKGINLQFRGRTVAVDLIPKMRIEMIVRNTEVEGVIRAVRENGRTGKPGDGRIFVLPIETAARVRTDEIDPSDQ